MIMNKRGREGKIREKRGKEGRTNISGIREG